jgi:hypothetical protein
MEHVMRIIAVIIICSVMVGCAKKAVTEREFKVIWKDYVQREFEESFAEEQSADQRKKILKDVLSAYGFKLDEFKEYVAERHAGKLNRIF